MPGEGDNSPVALVTGGGSGIGRATAIKFARAGCRVVVVDVDKAKADETCTLLQDAVPGSQCLSIHCDISSEDEVKSMMQQTQEAFGRLDYACNNAGISGDVAAIHDMSLEAWDQVMSVNLRGHFIAMKHQIPVMVTSSTRPAIVIISSICGHQAHPGMAAYTASKFAVRGLAMAAASEYGPRGLRVNTISPGAIDTPLLANFVASEKGAGVLEKLMREGAHITPAKPGVAGPSAKKEPLTPTESGIAAPADAVKPQPAAKDEADERVPFQTLPLHRAGLPEEVADAVVWLCMHGDYVTGADLVIDGGAMARMVL